MNIILLGYRGTGKSVVSRLLAKKLSRRLFSLDEMIEEAVGIPIPEIVSLWGWSRFREIETTLVAQVCEEAENAVIDCGGGVVLNGENITLLKRKGKAVLLTAEFDALISRLKRDKGGRPRLEENLSWEDEHRKVLAEREGQYRAAADFVCDTTDQKPNDTVHDIIEFFKRQSWIDS
ncbi:MAG: AAA family ATPase [Nitrospinaceae bacterium]|nr:AAA family ATPase [Nitrospinaceae bacterium]